MWVNESGKLIVVPDEQKNEPEQVADKKALRELLSEKFTNEELSEEMGQAAREGNYDEAGKIQDVLNSRKQNNSN